MTEPDKFIGNGIEGKILEEVIEIERHLHNREKWFGIAVTPVGETHRADRMAGGVQPFILTAGNDDFGAWIQILGSDDTPVSAGMEWFDAHRMLVSDTNSTAPYIIQIATGEAADLAAKIAAEEFTELPYISQTNNADSGIEDVMTIRPPVGEKVWARVANIGGNGTTIALYFGIHEYQE